jgi:hypothetical protein
MDSILTPTPALHRSDHCRVDISTGILEEYGSRDSSVGIKADYVLKVQGVRVRSR